MKLDIKDKLTAKNMSRYELSKRIGVTYPTITSIYNGESTSIKLEILEALCRELDCTPNEIILPEDKYVKNNIELNKLTSELIPYFIDSNKGYLLEIQCKKDIQNELFDLINKYINALNNKKGDTD